MKIHQNQDMQKENGQFTKSLAKSFGFALDGIKVLLQERNFRIHLAIAFLVVVCGFYFEVSLNEWCILILSIGLVLLAEGFNSAIELICNRITTDQDPIIGRIKDVSAAAVLLISMCTAMVGVIVFWPKVSVIL